MVQSDTLTRPSDAISITADNSGASNTVFTFYPSSQGRADKNQQQDDTIVVGDVVDVSWLPCLLLELKRATLAGGKFFPLTLAQCEAELRANAASAGLARLGMTPHGNRHGGASLMGLGNVGSVKIQTRGRWA